jgi:cytochrome c peroxidase
MRKALLLFTLISLVVVISCSKSSSSEETTGNYPAIKAAFGTNIDPKNPIDYAGQKLPDYVGKNNAKASPTHNAKATLGRVLFYDKALSIDNSISCASCHQQKFAFGDTAVLSRGVAGAVTIRHSMRLINTRFSDEPKFFWNERAATLEIQTTMPIRDHAEMGFSGEIGRPGIAQLLGKLQGIDYYKELFQWVYGDVIITETRMQESLANFIRTIQSFDSKYDVGLAKVTDDAPFPNFTEQENQGKALFNAKPQFDLQGSRTGGGLGCGGCHQPPAFDINTATLNNGVIGIANSSGIDLGNTRSPSLRDLVQQDGTLNGPLMHTGAFRNLETVLTHYNAIKKDPGNVSLDQKLMPYGFEQRLNLTKQEADATIAFLRTLSGNNVYTEPRWGNPFK